MELKNLAILIIIFIIIAAGSFYAGSQTGTKQQATQNPGSSQGFRSGFGSRQGQGFRQGQGMNGARGEIVAMDDKSITIKLSDGSSKIVLYTDKTTYEKSIDGSRTDLQNGQQVMVLGTQNSDGSITAQSVQINPRARPNASGNATM